MVVALFSHRPIQSQRNANEEVLVTIVLLFLRPEACRQIERNNSDADAVNNVPVGPCPRTPNPKKANIDIALADLRK